MVQEESHGFVVSVSQVHRMGESAQSLLAQAGEEAFFCCQNYIPSLASQQ